MKGTRRTCTCGLTVWVRGARAYEKTLWGNRGTVHVCVHPANLTFLQSIGDNHSSLLRACPYLREEGNAVRGLSVGGRQEDV